MNYCEESLKFIESEEMRECFRNTLFTGKISTRLRFCPERDCRDFIVGSRYSIEEKIAAFRKLPQDKNTIDLINVAETALAELKSTDNTVFLTTLHYPYDTTGISDTWEDRVPFLSFESVMKYVKKQTAWHCEAHEETLEQCVERLWYEVEKFIPVEDGELQHKITWALNAKGEILFFELGKEDKEHWLHHVHDDDDNNSSAWFDWEGQELTYPPIPFDFGDIITIDMRPYCKAYHAVIVRIGDNCDCCSVACIYCDEDGYLYCRTLKHNMDTILSKISPLYRAARFEGELPENESVLKVISEAIKKVPSSVETTEDGYVWHKHDLANQFDDFLYSDEYKRRKGRFGCSWEDFKNKFGL